MLKKIVVTILGTVFVGMSVALTIKAAVGVGAYDAFSQCVSGMLHIKVGTMSTIINISCVLGQVLILRKDFKKLQIIQVFVAFILGFVINFFLYDVFGTIVLDQYIIKLICCILGIVFTSIGVAIVLSVNLIYFPLEGLCKAIADKYNRNFGRLRQFVDIASVAIVLILWAALGQELTVREGTIIGMLIFAPLLTFFMTKLKPYLTKAGLIQK